MSPEAAEPLLSIRDLTITLPGGRAAPVRDVSLDVGAGEAHALVGESGAGKTLTARAVLGMLPFGARVTGGVRFAGRDIGPGTHRELWGRDLGFVPQDTLSVLSPVHSVGDQLAASLRSLGGLGRREARAAAVAALDRVGIPDAARRVRAYPHEFSGGMRQRAVIALATLHRPRLLVADEPTTALDPLVQDQILALLAEQRAASGAALLLITHDLPLVSRWADRVTVLHAGVVQETGPAPRVLTEPQAAYTRRLVTATRRGPRPTPSEADPDLLLSVRDLTVHHLGRRRGEAPVTAVDKVSFDVARGETLALVGPSGSGKSSTAEAVLRLRPAASGSVLFRGRELLGLDEAEMRALRPRIQPVFQDPYGSLSPRRRVRDAIAEPLRVQGRWDDRSGPERVGELLRQVGLDPTLGARRPHELSGGQCQRVGIARALASEPEVLILDEPVSALDPTVRAGVLDLLESLQHDLGLGYLFICHDMDVVASFAHRVAVLKGGKIVETLPANALATPAEHHPHTRELLTSA
ncbi:ATP-binding cassette domain-containing protein [Streptomyces monashensis]|uniref:ATP-binding cassette domain-containing protein n=1 Tax=Streptomyces monashensis TaxID=1678012 RepID=UPI000B13A1C1|nr:ABC transporter ATP-binding protein [Streptomyces monashensis]